MVFFIGLDLRYSLARILLVEIGYFVEFGHLHLNFKLL